MATVTDTALRHPALDSVLPVAVLAVWALAGGMFPAQASTELMLTALASSGGLVMAVATFAAGIMYQSSDERVVEVRARFMDQLRRNWTWIFCSLLAATLLPIAGLALSQSLLQWAFGLAILSALLVVTNLLRVVYLLRLVLFLESIETERHQRAPAPAPKF